MKSSHLLLAGILVMGLGASPAQAALLDFVIQPPSTSGYITFNGSDPLTASGINVGNIVGIGSGDIIDQSALPVPTTAWLLASGLFGMAAVARRRNHAAHPR